jgi:hypothetical protein
VPVPLPVNDNLLEVVKFEDPLAHNVLAVAVLDQPVGNATAPVKGSLTKYVVTVPAFAFEESDEMKSAVPTANNSRILFIVI